MAVNIKNEQVEKLLDEVVQLTGESKTDAVRKALEQRSRHLALHAGQRLHERRLAAVLEDEIWPRIPSELLGMRLTRAEVEAILGYGEAGV